jgi:hypothetical protein
MSELTDILCDETGDLLCSAGDLATGVSTLQHQADLLEASEGEYKQSPTTGIGISNFLNDEDPREMIRKIRMQFDGDGILISSLSYNQVNGSFNIKAAHK